MSALVDLIAFVVVILVCVGVHEFGHFVAAKLSGIRVDEFSLGFGPRLGSVRRGETRYSVRLLPLGGFVRMAGMLGLPGEADAGERNFYRASRIKRLLVMFAGIAANVILAFILTAVAVMLPSPSTVGAGTPAYAGGLRDGDSIVAIDSQPIDHSSAETVFTAVHDRLQADRGKPATVEYRTPQGRVTTTTITPRLAIFNTSPDNPSCDPGKLPEEQAVITAINGHAVGTGDATELLSAPGTRVSGTSLGPDLCVGQPFQNAPVTGLGTDVTASWQLGVSLDFQGLSLMDAAAASAQQIWSFPGTEAAGFSQLLSTPGSGGIVGPNGLQGPVGIAQEAGQTAGQGLKAILEFIGFISLNLAFVNVLPIPFLDGGKILMVLIEVARRGRRLAPEREAAVYAIGLTMIVLLVIFITISDLRRH